MRILNQELSEINFVLDFDKEGLRDQLPVAIFERLFLLEHNSVELIKRWSNNTISELVDANWVRVTDCDQIRDLIVNDYEEKFNGDDSVPVDFLFNVEHDSISMEESARTDQLPSIEEIHEAVFGLGADSAHGPDGFAGFFYRHYWEIIRDDLIFTKILATRLGSILDKLVSKEQVAFMKGRNIHENISLASETVNELQIKRKEGNVGLKLDITQAFDTVSWTFIVEVFRRYGFSENWCDWILQILKSARISVLVNGSPEGFFKKCIAPSHLFFDDDIMIFCKGNMKSLRNLVDLLGLYQRASGQTISREKSKLYYGGGSLRRRDTIADFLGMPIATLPDRYLGVKVMPGAVKYHHIAYVVEKIENQLAGWKGDSQVSRSFVVAYDKICAPYEEGGLGITQLSVMNKVLLMSLWWKIRIKWVYSLVEDNSKVLIGDRRNTSLYYDVWVGDMDVVDILEDFSLDRVVLVGDMLNNGVWSLSEECRNTLLVVGIDEADLPTPLNGEDCRVWKPNFSGTFTVKSAKSLIRKRYVRLKGANLLSRQSVHPDLDERSWKILRGACATLDKVKRRFKIQVVNKCCLCNNEEETLDHLRWHCAFAEKAWGWISDTFGMHSHLNLSTAYKAARGRSGMIKDLWFLAVLVHDYSRCLKGYMNNTVDDLKVLDYFKVSHRQVKMHNPVECRWTPSALDELLLCCDGVARGNPGVDGAGVVARDYEANIVSVMSVGLGITSNYLAEIYGTIVGLKWAVQ
ncbi:uncharacterized protein LOC113332120 [Papaver somniferum]|uniref:uncharacterized protein LOC113332120 n=1 Tax=Papaver somniferum TaxID=3469 RepID=UPI000E701C77|nr:uncharacterized protein LOC113332120 [Papaver somniferum]